MSYFRVTKPVSKKAEIQLSIVYISKVTDVHNKNDI